MPATATVPSTTRFEVTPSQAAIMIAVLLDADQPVMLHGDPGVGKSQLAYQATALRNSRMIERRISMMSDVDIAGLPFTSNGRTDWSIPAFFPSDENEDVVMFWDEINRGLVSTMNACLQVILDKRVGDVKLPARVRHIAAVNDKDVGTNPMPSALTRRFTHIYVKADVRDWITWAGENDIEPVVMAFIRFRPDLLADFDPKAVTSPNPRGWAFTSRIVAKNGALPHDLKMALYTGTVGTTAAFEFSAFEQVYRTLPNIQAILLNPSTADVPSTPAVQYAVANALAHDATPVNAAAVFTYLNRMPTEYQAFAASAMLRRDPTLANTRAFTVWGAKNQNYF